ncbi:uncharacterized protein LOC118810202 isoform X1 [Colossoma macropomum]|uniref:uncharacterized protein LOC118810202 isoform X1 n=1 Tax=Colossoma macropomum TaxID=42526 RepID=UPI0018640152|nr:uncharacterized protein LOC118810202 isoform X1 [Colossoma macropomum]
MKWHLSSTSTQGDFCQQFITCHRTEHVRDRRGLWEMESHTRFTLTDDLIVTQIKKGYQLNMKTEPHMFSINSSEELHFLRSRVQMLEREKAEMAAENQRLKDLLVKEIPHLLSTMWQTITSNAGQPSHHQPGPSLSESINAGVSSYMPAQYKEQDCSLLPSVSVDIKGVQQEMILETGAYGHKIAGSHNGADGGMFESMDDMNGNLCPSRPQRRWSECVSKLSMQLYRFSIFPQ